MAQLFKPYANVIAKASVVAGVATPVLIGLAVAAVSRSPYNTKVEVPINQPVPFSHQHHAFELGIDCRYCHTSVETSSFAGIPPSETCMSCHSQIWTNSPLLEPVRESYETGKPLVWNKVNWVPEFVNFNHSIHIARGVSCNQCHGAVQNMQITWRGKEFQMQWCLQCHRAPEKYLYKPGAAPEGGHGEGEAAGDAASHAHEEMSPRQQVFNLYWKYQESGVKGMSPREIALLQGREQESTRPADVAIGKRLVNEYGVKVQQLSDCSVCHY